MKKSNEKTSTDGQLAYQDPYIFNIKNITDEKLYNVKLFDRCFNEQKKIIYINLFDKEEGYRRFLSQLELNRHNDVIGKIKMIVVCDYNKHRVKQVNVPFFERYTSADGGMNQHAHSFMLDPYQQQNDIVEVKGLQIKLNHELQIELAYLMPETEIQIWLFPLKTLQKI